MRFNWIIWSLLLAMTACSKKQAYVTEIIGHAGNGLTIKKSIHPANTKEGIELALGLPGVAGVEIDVQLAKDGTLWLMHDDDLSIETDGKGCVSEKMSSELRKIKFKTVNREKLTCITDLDWGQLSTKTVYLDIRHYNACTQQVYDPQLMIQALNVAFSSINTSTICLVLNYKPWLSLFHNEGWRVYSEVHSEDEFSSSINDTIVEGLVMRNSFATKEQVSIAQIANKKVILYDMRAPKPIRRALEKLPDAIMVDDIKAALIEKEK
jgi:glycerophosphoryl diester phosphodiesterase